MTLVYILLFTAVLLYGGGCFYLYIRQERLVFAPSRNMAETPADWGYEYEEYLYGAEKKAFGWFIPASVDTQHTLIFCHGKGGNISHRGRTVNLFRSLGINVLLAEYPGYGKCTLEVSETNCYNSVEAALEWLNQEKKVPYQKMVVLGRSLGGPIAAHAVMNKPVKGLILESTFTSLKEAAKSIYPWMPPFGIIRYDFNTMDYLRNVTAPLLVIHSNEDELIPYEMGKELFSSYNNADKSFLDISGVHYNGYELSASVYLSGLRKFINDQ